MTQDVRPYGRAELRQGTGSPERGERCHRCGVVVPRFKEMSPALLARLNELIDGKQSSLAVRELKAAVGCPQAFAQAWVAHRGRAHPDKVGPPCPYCFETLPCDFASKCDHCGEDWGHYDVPHPDVPLHRTVGAAIESLRRHEGLPEMFLLALDDSLQDAEGLNVALVQDAACARGWVADAYHTMRGHGYRIYRFKR